MNKNIIWVSGIIGVVLLVCFIVWKGTAPAEQNLTEKQAHTGIISAIDTEKTPSFDLTETHVVKNDQMLVFTQKIASNAGLTKPTSVGKLEGAQVFGYVWPTTLDSSTVGFEKGQGILALAVTSHPDFDDTPEQDENNDGNAKDDGSEWHSHWVVLEKNAACAAGLSVKEIPSGVHPVVPKDWAGLPLLLSSPGYKPTIQGTSVEVTVPTHDLASLSSFNYDGVTSELHVHTNEKEPLLCVTEVYDVASGDLSLPGKAF